jgi:hypothetical protein
VTAVRQLLVPAGEDTGEVGDDVGDELGDGQDDEQTGQTGQGAPAAGPGAPGNAQSSGQVPSQGAPQDTPPTGEETAASDAETDGGLGEDDGVQWVAADINGTWDDHVIATRYGHQPVPGGPVKIESYEIPYSIREDGQVLLGDPQPVTLTPISTGNAANTLPGMDASASTGSAGEVPSPLPGMIDDTTAAAKTFLAVGGMETKAGWVLSGLNRDRLVQAVQSLLDVLAAAGVTLNPPDPDEFGEQDVDELGADIATAVEGEQDTTAPSARPMQQRPIRGKRLIPSALYAAGLRTFLDAHADPELE